MVMRMMMTMMMTMMIMVVVVAVVTEVVMMIMMMRGEVGDMAGPVWQLAMISSAPSCSAEDRHGNPPLPHKHKRPSPFGKVSYPVAQLQQGNVLFPTAYYWVSTMQPRNWTQACSITDLQPHAYPPLGCCASLGVHFLP